MSHLVLMSLYGQNLLIQILEWQEKWKTVSFKDGSVRAEIHTHTQKDARILNVVSVD